MRPAPDKPMSYCPLTAQSATEAAGKPVVRISGWSMHHFIFHPDLYPGVPLVARRRLSDESSWSMATSSSRRPSTALSREYAESVQASAKFMLETTASQTPSQEGSERRGRVRHIASHRGSSCQCDEPFRPWSLGSGWWWVNARKACLVTLVVEEPVQWWKAPRARLPRCRQQGDVWEALSRATASFGHARSRERFLRNAQLSKELKRVTFYFLLRTIHGSARSTRIPMGFCGEF